MAAAMRRHLERRGMSRRAGMRAGVAILTLLLSLTPGVGRAAWASATETSPGPLGSGRLYLGQFGVPGFYPSSVAIGHGGGIDGKVFVADSSSVQEFSASGRFLTSLGAIQCNDDSSPTGSQAYAAAIASGYNGVIYVLYTDFAGGNFLRTYDFHTSLPSTGDCPTTQQFPGAQGIAVDRGGNLYVSETRGGVVEFTPSGAFVRRFGTIPNPLHSPSDPTSADEVDSPGVMTFDTSGNLYVGDGGTQRVIEFSPSGAVLQHFGDNSTRQMPDEGRGPGELTTPLGIAVDRGGNVYVSDEQNGQVTEFSSSGVALSRFGANSYLFVPRGIAIEGSVIYVADSGDGVIQEFGVAGAPVTASDSAVTSDSSAPRPAQIGGLSATPGGGTGTVNVANYDSNPTGVTLTDASVTGADAYFDVEVSPGSSFGSLTVARCGASATDKVYWFDGLLWQEVSPQSYNAATGCITMNLDSTSSPTVAQLTGTPFALGIPNGGASGGPVPSATPELGSGELLATGLLPLGAMLLYRRRARRVTR